MFAFSFQLDERMPIVCLLYFVVVAVVVVVVVVVSAIYGCSNYSSSSEAQTPGLVFDEYFLS